MGNILSEVERDLVPKVGTILRVDYERMLMDVLWTPSRLGKRTQIPIAHGHMSARSFLGGMPEEGAFVVCLSLPGTADPIPVGYLPANYKAALNFDEVDRFSQEKDAGKVGVRPKLRKMYPGELQMSSTQGSEIFVDEDVHLESSALGEITLRSSDNSIIQNSLQYYRSTDGSRVWDGMAKRSVAPVFDENGSFQYYGFKLPEEMVVMNDDSSLEWVPTLEGINLDDGGKPFIEVRTEIAEFGDGVLAITGEMNGGHDIESLLREKDAPYKDRLGNIIESTSGTLIGYDPIRRPDLYGRVLRPQIFQSPTQTFPILDEVPVNAEGPDYGAARMLAAAFMWKMPFEYSGTRFYVSKEGQLFMHVGASRQFPNGSINGKAVETWPYESGSQIPLMGAGRSVEANFEGSIKAVVGKNRDDEESIILDTLGQVRFHLGSDDGTPPGLGRPSLIEGKPLLPPYSTPNPDMLAADGFEKKSMVGTMDGGIVLRVGRDNMVTPRKFHPNGFDPTGREVDARYDVRNEGRRVYGEGDSFYRFHDMSQVGDLDGMVDKRNPPQLIRAADSISDPDLAAHSLDAHFVSNVMLRVGKDIADGKSLTMDLDGALIAALGADNADNRSLIVGMDGGVEARIGRNKKSGYSIQAFLEGGIRAEIGHGHDDQAINLTYHSAVEQEANGDFISTVKGKRKDKVLNNHEVTIVGHQQTSIGGDHVLTVRGKSHESIGVVTEAEAKKIGIALGDYLLDILKGNVKLRTKMGDFDFETLLGHIFATTKAGEILIETLLGNATLRTAIGNIVIEAIAGRADINALQVGIGLPAPRFPIMVANSPTTPCMVLGIPHVGGSMTVSASL